jgi:hypothetical protein
MRLTLGTLATGCMLLLVGVCVPDLSASAQDVDPAGQMATCRQQSDSLDRLRCYDAIALPIPKTAANSTVLYTFSGNGTTTTRPFQVGGPWELQWDTSGPIAVTISNTNGNPVGGGSSDAGKGQTYVRKGGTYSVEVMALMGRWTMRVIAVP